MAINLVMLAGGAATGQAVTTPQQLVFTQGPAGSGTCHTFTAVTIWPSSCEPQVQVEDLTNAKVDSTDSITLSITTPNGATLVCSSGLTRYASNGLVGFDGCQIDKAGTYTLTATDNTNPSPVTQNGTSASFVVNPGAATQLGVSGIANPSTAGTASSVTVTAEDAGGNTAACCYAGTVHFTSTDGAASLPADYTFTGGDANVHTFPVTLNTVGSGHQTVTATDTVTSTITGSQTVAVQPGAVNHIAITPTGASTTAGNPETYAVNAYDAEGNLIGDVTSQATFNIAPNGGSTGATCTGGSGSNGGAPGNNKCGATQAGSYTVQAAYSGKNDSTGLTVNAAAGGLTFTAGPDVNSAGTQVQNGGFETGDFTGWTASSSGAALAPAVSTAEAYSGTHSALVGSAGAAEGSGDSTLTSTFTVPSGTSTLTFLYWPQGTISGDFQEAYVTCGTCAGAQNNVTVFKGLQNDMRWHPVQFDLSYAAGKIVNLVFDVHQSGGTTTATGMYVDDVLVDGQGAGTAFVHQPVLTVKDTFGNVVTSFNGPVTLSLAPGTGTAGAGLSCTANPVDASSGVATFSGCKVDTTGYFYELAASASTYAQGTSAPFSAPGAILGFGQSPNNSTGGVAFSQQPVVDSLAGDGTVNSGDSSTMVTLGITPNTGSPSGSLTCASKTLTVASGVASYSGCSVDRASMTAYSLTATGIAADGTHALPATSGTFTISAGPTAKFAVSGLADPTTAGQTQTVTVTPEDAGGNSPNSAYTGSVAISFTPSGAGTSSPSSVAAGACGTSCSLSVQLTKAGPQVTVTASDGGSISGSQSVAVVPAAAASLAVSAPSSTVAGNAFSSTVTALDPYGNTATGYRGTIHFTSTDGAATLPADYAFVSGDQGSKTFSNGVTLNTAGNQTITATDTVHAAITGTSGTIDVTPGSPASITISPKTTTAAAGDTVSFTATAFDGSHNEIGVVTDQTTFTISPDGSCTGGTGASGGAPGNNACGATLAGLHMVTASYQGHVDTASLSVDPAGPASITISPQDATTSQGSAVTYSTTAYDQYGNTIGDVTSATTFSISPDGSCTQGGSSTPPGNNNCGSGAAGTHTVTGDYMGLEAGTGLTVSGWGQLPGSARDVGAWGSSSLWVIGTNATAGGYGIYQQVGGGWAGRPGGAGRIAVGPSGNPVVINSSNAIYQWNGSSWQHLAGAAMDVAVGGTGSDSIYAIGTNPQAGGYGIWHYSNGGWTSLPGGGVRIAVGPDGNPAVVNSSGGIYRWNGSAWQRLPGSARDIGIGPGGTLYVIGTNSVPGGGGVYQWTGGGFIFLNGGGVNISVGASDLPVVTNGTYGIWEDF